MQKLLKKHAEKIRFAIAGVLATGLDFGILFTLVVFGLPSIASNFVSTSVAMTFSFFLNKSYTFKDDGKSNTRQVVNFFVITIIGIWVIQPLIIGPTNLLLGSSWFTHSQLVVWIGSILGSWFKASYLVLLIGKGLATVASLTWNYIMYSRFVFKKQSDHRV